MKNLHRSGWPLWHWHWLRPHLAFLFLLLFRFIDLPGATIFSTSLQQCHDQCLERNLALPLPPGHLGWPNISQTNCDFDCLLDACKSGCQDLESSTSGCDVRCDSIGAGSAACFQGCRAISDIFLHQIQGLVNLASVEAFADPMQGIGLNWSFPEAQSTVLQEISTTNIRWVAQSRAAGRAKGWRWNQMDQQKAFKENALISTIFVPPEQYADIELRLASIWRDFVVVSRLFRQTILLDAPFPTGTHRPRPSEGPQLQLSASSFVVCWNTEEEALAAAHESPQYRLRLFSIHRGDEADEETEGAATIGRDLVETRVTASNCHLLRNLTGNVEEGKSNQRRHFQLAIGEIGGGGGTANEEKPPEEANAEISEQELLLNITLQDINEPEEQPRLMLVFTNGSALLLMENLDDFVMLTDPQRIPFPLNESQTITALGAHSATELLVGLSDGSIFALDVNERLRSAAAFGQFAAGANGTEENGGAIPEMPLSTTAAGLRIRPADGVAIQQIVVDHLQERFYALRDKSGIVRCQLKTCENSTTLTLANSPTNFVQSLSCDPWNGYLYYATASGDTFSTPLFPLDAPQNYSLSIIRRIGQLPSVNTVEVDLQEQKLIVLTKQGQMMGRDLVDGSVRDERGEGWTISGTGDQQYKNVIRSQFHRNRLFWLSNTCGGDHPFEGACLFSEEFDRHEAKKVHLNKYLYAGPIKEFVLLRQLATPPLMMAPSKIGLILSDSEALISWKAPISMPFQASGNAWRSLSYEFILLGGMPFESAVDLMANASATDSSVTMSTATAQIIAQSSIQQDHHLVQINSAANGEFTALVKACIGNVCSAQVRAKNRPIRLDEVRKSVSLMTKRSSSNGAAEVSASASATVGTLTAVDILGKEVPAERALLYPQIPSEPDISFAFDNSSNVLYTSSRKDSVIRQRIMDSVGPQSSVPFLHSSFVHQLALGPNANLLLATTYSLYAFRRTSSFVKILYNCASGGEECGEIIGIAVDDGTYSSATDDGEQQKEQQQGRLFLLIQMSSGTMQLLQTGADLDQPFQMVASIKHFPYIIRQIAFADNRLLILTEDGLFGTLDLSLQNVNLNLAIRDVQNLLAADNAGPSTDRHIHFDGPIQFDAKSSQLRWNIVGTNALQAVPDGVVPTLFKLTLFRDGFGSGGERTMAQSQQSWFALPPKLVLAWQSRQRFDVQVEAINAWTRVWANRTGLNAATKPPSQPEAVRIFATQQRTVDGTRALIDLFWEEPREWNGDKFGYQLNCTISQQGTDPNQYVNGTLKGSQRQFSFAVRSGRISCLVFAMNDQHLMGPPSTAVEIDGSEFKPLIRLVGIDSTDNLVAIQNWTIDASKSSPNGGNSQNGQIGNGNGGNKVARFLAAKHRHRRQSQPSPVPQYQTVTFVGNELYAVRKEPDNSQLFLVRLDMNQVDVVLYKASLVGDFTQIDAMAADWVANRLLLIGNREMMQIQLDQLQQDSATISPKRLFQLSMWAQDAKQLVFDPFTNTAFLLTKNGSLFALDLNKGTEANLELTTGCLKQKTITSIVSEFTWNRAASPQMYALTWNGLMELKLGADTCPDVNVNWEVFGERGLKSISLFAVADKVFIFSTPNELLVYDRGSATISQFPIASPPLKSLLAVSQSSQPFPDRDCFQLPSPSSQLATFTVRNEGRTGALVEMPEPQRDLAQVPAECLNISLPQTQYEVHFRKRGTDKEKIVHSNSNKTFIDQGVLDKNTDYDVSVGWLNRYWPAQGQSEAKMLHTGFGFPSAPKDPSAMSLSPDTVLLSWQLPDLLNAPATEIRYRISQQNQALITPAAISIKPQEGGIGHFSPVVHEVAQCEANPCQAKVPNLRPSTDYHFWVTALHLSRLNTPEDLEATSVETQAHTRDIPGTLRLENVTSSMMNLRWNTLPGADSGFPPIHQIQISVQYRESGGKEVSWLQLQNSTFLLEQNGSSTRRPLCIDKLAPATTYDYRYAAEYTILGANPGMDEGAGAGDQKEKQQPSTTAKEQPTISEFFYAPVQQGKTKAGTPMAPRNVRLVNEPIGNGGGGEGDAVGGWTLRWAEPESDGGEPIVNYAVEYRPDAQSEWEISERGLPADRLYWRVAWAESHARHGKTLSDAELAEAQFRIRAANSEGFGDFGYTQLEETGSGQRGGGTRIFWYIFWAFLLALLLICAAGYGFLRWKMTKRRKIRAKAHKPICLDEISKQIQQSNPAASAQMQQFSPEVQNELKILPKIVPERVKVSKQLGMGSFGRVCEGFMRLDRQVSVRVAIKYLKDNSHENRIKFLKEAILMNNFDHPNIVKLLGVNMLEGEHFLVLELMDGGDMLNFLRDSRPQKGNQQRLCLRDLIAMAVDIGRGCVYLETYKHVHRDIAARNCLISSRTSPQRVTKIADFGLARSLFVDDYYRVHGQDMLPLRWLSPEVITQGLFTSKSDVWAYGVLLWEIITLGEQPYANKHNAEVLNLLSNGICMERPMECPNELHEIMRSCWTVDHEQRPRFLDLQPKMESIRGLPHFQSRDPFPSGFWNGYFDHSQDSQSTSTRGSTSTTTNGGGNGNDSSAGGGGGTFHFEKSENAPIKKHSLPPPRLSKQMRQSGIGNSAGACSSAFSTGTTMTALDASADYELPIRPHCHSIGCRPTISIASSSTTPAAPSPAISLAHRRRAAFQNNAFIGDSSMASVATAADGDGQSAQWASRSYKQFPNTGGQESPATGGSRQFGGSTSSRVSRV